MTRWEKLLSDLGSVFKPKPKEVVKSIIPNAPVTPVTPKPVPPPVVRVEPKPVVVAPKPTVEVKPEVKPVTVERNLKLEKAIASISQYSGKYAQVLAALMMKYGIDTPLRQMHFLAQIGHESGEFRLTEEGLSYRPANIVSKFKKYFRKADGTVDMDLVNAYAFKPEKLANRVYANRMGNGNEASGDGWKHRGGGLIQVTGKAAQMKYSLWKYGDTRVMDNPSMLYALEDAAGSAVYYWMSNNLNRWADQDDVLKVSRAVNIGNPNSTAIPNGLEHRKELLKRLRSLL